MWTTIIVGVVAFCVGFIFGSLITENSYLKEKKNGQL